MGKEAPRVFRDQPDVDLQVMPNMTSMQLTEQLRSLRPDLPIIIATATPRYLPA